MSLQIINKHWIYLQINTEERLNLISIRDILSLIENAQSSQKVDKLKLKVKAGLTFNKVKLKTGLTVFMVWSRDRGKERFLAIANRARNRSELFHVRIWIKKQVFVRMLQTSNLKGSSCLK